MEGFEPFKRTPLTREQLEKESEPVRKTGEILRGMKEAPEVRQNIEDFSDRDARKLEALSNEIEEAKRYIRHLSGFDELQKIGDARREMSPEELAAALKDFDRRYPETRKEVGEQLEEIRVRRDAVERIQAKKEPEIPFERAA